MDSLDLLVKLGVSILMPVLVGKGLREAAKPLREAVPRFKAPLYLINNLQVCVLCVLAGLSGLRLYIHKLRQTLSLTPAFLLPLPHR